MHIAACLLLGICNHTESLFYLATIIFDYWHCAAACVG